MTSQKHVTLISLIVAAAIVAGALIWKFPKNPTYAPTPTSTPYVYEPQLTTSGDPVYSDNSKLNYDITQRSPRPAGLTFTQKSFPVPSQVATIEQPGVVWLKEPVEMHVDPGVFKTGDGGYKLGDGVVEMYKVGSQDGKDLFYVFITEMGQSVDLFRNEGNRLALITSEENPYMADYSERVYVDRTTHLAALEVPHPLFVSGIPFTFGGGNYMGYYFFDKVSSDMTLFAHTPYGPMYLDRKLATVEDPVENQIFKIRLADGGGETFDVDYGFIKDDRVPQITWSDGSKNTVVFDTGHSGGCGQGNPEVVPFAAANGKIFQVGTTSTGEPVYDFVDPQSPIMKKFYDRTDGAVYSYQPNGGGQYALLPLSEFVKNHGVFIYRDQLGRFVIFHNSMYGPQAECGKPVIYLYPTHEIPVSVKVGARVTVSEPAYNGGWNVLAEPTGKQTLFWEGIGNGAYPDITQGFIVKRADLEQTLRDHLAKLGLNARESQDFLDYWLAKMPTTPYTRLTWFGTRQMDTLAPLTVSPRPDTSIRIFLDFEGLEKPIDLPTQKLSAISRKGFTLVEWGGILRK